MRHRLVQVALVVAAILAVVVIERRSGVFSKVLGKIPGVNKLLG